MKKNKQSNNGCADNECMKMITAIYPMLCSIVLNVVSAVTHSQSLTAMQKYQSCKMLNDSAVNATGASLFAHGRLLLINPMPDYEPQDYPACESKCFTECASYTDSNSAFILSMTASIFVLLVGVLLKSSNVLSTVNSTEVTDSSKVSAAKNIQLGELSKVDATTPLREDKSESSGMRYV